MAYTSSNGDLKTNAILITADGKEINLGHIDRKLFGKIKWSPRLWYYKYITYRIRARKLRKEP